jgi:uncharacterized YccA/Bax inhibitor family protein
METPKCRCGNPADKKLSLEPEIGFFYFCSQECKDTLVSQLETDREISENNQYRQGKSRASYEASMKVLTVTGIILTIVVIFAIISYAIALISKQLI